MSQMPTHRFYASRGEIRSKSPTAKPSRRRSLAKDIAAIWASAPTPSFGATDAPHKDCSSPPGRASRRRHTRTRRLRPTRKTRRLRPTTATASTSRPIIETWCVRSAPRQRQFRLVGFAFPVVDTSIREIRPTPRSNLFTVVECDVRRLSRSDRRIVVPSLRPELVCQRVPAAGDHVTPRTGLLVPEEPFLAVETTKISSSPICMRRTV